ncbi:MAG: conjugative transposon DNA recombination protein [Comamonadaceae bacterium]|nr:MAG: conjugative transposon DNA recombination protein [Comamonadaceae bacterium]
MLNKIKVQGYRLHKNLSVDVNQKFNLIVGANESGKSTLIEAITLGLTGRVNGRSVSEELNPHWFNANLVKDFIQKRAKGINAPFHKY